MALSPDRRAEFAGPGAKRNLEFVALRSEIREAGSRLEGKIEAATAEIVNGIFNMIPGALIVNIVATVAGTFGLTKLLGH